MNDRWARAEERHRQSVEERRYRRRDSGWGADDRAPRGRGSRHAAPVEDDWDDYDDDTTVIPVYTDEEPEPVPPPRPPRSGQRSAGTRKRPARGRPVRDEDDGEEPPRRRSSRSPSGRGPSGRGQSARGKRSRVASRKAAERKRRRRNLWILGCVFVVLFVAAGGYAGYKFIGKLGGPEDFAGPAGPPVVVRVKSGDTAEQIAETMFDKGVVASSGAFYEAAVRNSKMTSVQPGFYSVPTHSKGSEAVTALMSKEARVGNVVISEGKRLHDSTDVNTGARNEGIYRKIADASCLGTGAAKKCVTYEQLDAAGASADLAALGVPAWAMDSVRQVPDRTRQLEGLIAAGTWDFDPSGTPEQILAQLVTDSTRGYESTGLMQSGAATGGLTPYQTLIAASLVEREALPNDMSKVARVIVNRLAANQPLQLDSTVNYTLDKTEVATTDADRAKRTPWNTYAMPGLPATPISSPSLEALRAMETPAPGAWLYFVTVDKQGTTMFTDSYSEHLRNIERAQQSGILDSGR
ncbi:endolytic transglycosylase MltG [Nocardia blacklockiae]|uniref:endolytic transglycosylase MltG n=1 Tax=Nocardia blacklockiae TaxID=480036 RepID=UPI001894A1DF|nr:endolytic transglycosylase MltG [Nocardia blacklockiae]MBF6170315.1 endolytic transglycosylase MltG [Nocardia blacklockiae]